jgi:predicted lysophospholipase L1 biosynthesis ABC-type transport system permease subunit
MGRHSHPDDFESPEFNPVEAAQTAAAIRKSAQLAHPPAHPSKTSPVADLQLVMHDRRLRRVCLIAAVAPFLAYFVVIIALHEMHVWAIFIGAPLVLAGILIGAVLDRAYAQRGQPGEPAQTAPATAAIGPASAVPAELG